MTRPREFYETEYHFESDVETVGDDRLWRSIRLLEPLRGTTFLDVGSGVGRAAHLAHQRGGAAPVVGVDFAWKALRLGADSTPEVLRAQADGCHLPVRSDSMDRVLSFGSVEHFPDVVAGLREIRRVMADGAVAVIVVPNFFARTEQPQELRQSYWGWRRSFTAAGLRIVKTRGDFGPKIMRDRRPLRVVFRAAAKVSALIPGLPYQFIFVLRAAD